MKRIAGSIDHGQPQHGAGGFVVIDVIRVFDYDALGRNLVIVVGGPREKFAQNLHVLGRVGMQVAAQL